MPRGYFISDSYAFQIEFEDFKQIHCIHQMKTFISSGILIPSWGMTVLIKPHFSVDNHYYPRFMRFITRPKSISCDIWKYGSVYPYYIKSPYCPDLLLLCYDTNNKSTSVPSSIITSQNLEQIFVGLNLQGQDSQYQSILPIHKSAIHIPNWMIGLKQWVRAKIIRSNK